MPKGLGSPASLESKLHGPLSKNAIREGTEGPDRTDGQVQDLLRVSRQVQEATLCAPSQCCGLHVPGPLPWEGCGSLESPLGTGYAAPEG